MLQNFQTTFCQNSGKVRFLSMAVGGRGRKNLVEKNVVVVVQGKR